MSVVLPLLCEIGAIWKYNWWESYPKNTSCKYIGNHNVAIVQYVHVLEEGAFY